MAITNNTHALYTLDTFGRIISFLPNTDLFRITKVCKQWKFLTNQFSQMRLQNRSTHDQFVEYFSPFVNDGVMTWIEADRYSDLCIFSNKLLSKMFNGGLYAQAENPELEDEQIPAHRMPHPWVSYGNTTYSICNSSDIKVQKKGESDFKIIKGKEKTMFTHLAIENPFLFALRNDGYIVQFDLSNDQQNEIPSAWVTDENLSKSSSSFWTVGPFCVQEGYIIIKYRISNVFETIPYRNLQQRRLICVDSEKCMPADPIQILVKEGTVYMLGTNQFFVWDLEKNESIQMFPNKWPFNELRNFTLAHKMVFIFDDFACYCFNPETKKTSNIFKEQFWQGTIIENLLIVKIGINQIAVKNLNTGGHLALIQEIFQEAAFSVPHDPIKPEVVRQLIQICRQHCQEFVLSQEASPFSE